MRAVSRICLALAFALSPLAATAAEVRVFVTNSAGDSIHVIDPATNQVVQVIQGIKVPQGIGFSPDGARVYVSNEADSTLDIVERESGRVTAKVALSGHPDNIAVTKDGGRVLVAIDAPPGGLDIIDTATLTRVKTLAMKNRPQNVYVTPDSRYAVAGSIPGKSMTVVDLASEQVAWELGFDEGVGPLAFEANPDGSTHRVFVQLSNFHGFAVVDFAEHREVERIKLPNQPGGSGVAESRAGTPSHGIAVAPDGRTLWVDSILANAVFAYSLPDLTLVGHVSLPELRVAGQVPIAAGPDWLTFTPDSQRLYVSDAALNGVSVIDTEAMKTVGFIKVGEVPKRSNTLVIR